MQLKLANIFRIQNTKFTLIEQITEQLQLLQKKPENFWILKLETLPRWFEPRTCLHLEGLEGLSRSSCVQSLVYIPLLFAAGT